MTCPLGKLGSKTSNAFLKYRVPSIAWFLVSIQSIFFYWAVFNVHISRGCMSKDNLKRVKGLWSFHIKYSSLWIIKIKYEIRWEEFRTSENSVFGKFEKVLLTSFLWSIWLLFFFWFTNSNSSLELEYML